MTMFLHWKAPIELLEHELWTVEECLHIVLGYVVKDEVNFIESSERSFGKTMARLMKRNRPEQPTTVDVKKYLIEIATGNRPAQPYDLFPFSEEVPTEIFGRLEHLYKIIRLWRHTMHDNTQCENLTIGDPRAQRWRKEYFIYWGTKNGYKME